jgi:hypothetical protein
MRYHLLVAREIRFWVGLTLSFGLLATPSCAESEDVGKKEQTGGSAGVEAGGGPQCSVPADCAAPSSKCKQATCEDGICGTIDLPEGTLPAGQIAGDCRVSRCDGAGNAVGVADETDVPDDQNPCTEDVCTGTTASHSPSAAGTPCGTDLTCNGKGSCVACFSASSCPGTDTECITRTCIASVCGTSQLPAGTVIGDQTPGDCQKNVCGSDGTVNQVADDADVPNDGKQCTTGLCSSGVPSHEPVTAGTSCAETGGTLCDGNGNCVPATSCGSGTIDCDGSSANGCECSGNLCCGAGCSPPHINGLGQSFSNCAPLGVPGDQATYSLSLAMSARGAWTVSGTDGSAKCVGPNGGEIIYRLGGGLCAVWMYTGNAAGHVQLAAAASTGDCLCPSPATAVWY